MSADPSDRTVPDVSRIVTRFWAARAKGEDVSIDDVLDTTPGSEDHLRTRATAIRIIAAQAATLAADGGMPTGVAPDAATIPPPHLGPSASPDAPTHIPMHDSVVGTGGALPAIEGYDLIGVIGRGGMGAVYEGYQQATGRRVAVKFMLDAFAGADAIRKRFEREVEVVARLQHPGIVSIIDSGVRRGRYFFVMEYVAGRSLDKALAPGKCPLNDALELIAQVCDAVDYAHQRGVLHRDLKPGNILVDEHGRPHLLDFGLAKVFDPDAGQGHSHGALGITISGPDQLLGTVAYMSPEQARGRQDETSVRTDVYALGAIAYELITGRLPCRTDGPLREVLARITDEDPPPPSSIRKRLPRDLDAVLLKALEKRPEARYATAGEFAADIRRLLAGEPVLARRTSGAGRAWRWVRRNRSLSAVVATAVLTLAVVSTFLVARIVRERDLARENFALLRGILESADPDRSAGVTVLQLLDGAARQLDQHPPEQPFTEAEIREILGTVYRKFGAYNRAFENQSRALAIRESLARGGDDPALAEAMHNLAATLWWDGKYADAERLYQRSLDMRRRLYRTDHPAVAMSLTHLAACRLRLGQAVEARTLYQEALDMRRRLYGEVHEEVAQSLNNLAKCFLEAGEFDQAEVLFRRALSMIRDLRGDSHSGTASASQNLADCLLRRGLALKEQGRDADARAAALRAREAFAMAHNIRAGMYPDGHHMVAASMLGMARCSVLAAEGASAETLRTARDGVAMLRATRRPDHPDLADGLEILGQVLTAARDHAGAAAAFTEAFTIAEKLHPPAPALVDRLRRQALEAQAAIDSPG